MATASVTLPLNNTTKVLGMNSDEGRPVFEYVGGKRTENQRRNSAGLPLFRHKCLVQYSAQSAEEAALVIDSAAALGMFTPVRLDASATLTIRPEDAYSLVLTVSGSLVIDKAS